MCGVEELGRAPCCDEGACDVKTITQHGYSAQSLIGASFRDIRIDLCLCSSLFPGSEIQMLLRDSVTVI